jgi:hypothetical protein
MMNLLTPESLAELVSAQQMIESTLGRAER